MKSVSPYARIFAVMAIVTFAVWAVDASGPGETFILPYFPFARQETEYYCGDASLQMVYQYFTGLIVSQDLFANVARTSDTVGTLSNDMARAMHFSRFSQQASQNVSVSWRGSGYPDHDIGFSAAVLDLSTPWLSVMQKSLVEGAPVVVLQKFSREDSGGHWRVVYGFNDTHIFTKDPWDRDGQPRDLFLTYRDFIYLWQYTEKAELGDRYLGVAFKPWKLFVHAPNTPPTPGSRSEISVIYSYDSPFPTQLLQTQPKAEKQILEVRTDPAIWAVTHSPIIVNAPLAFGTTHKASFSLTCVASSSRLCQESAIFVRVSGIISSSVPQAVRYGNLKYPSYDYTDVIGSMWTEVRFLP